MFVIEMDIVIHLSSYGGPHEIYDFKKMKYLASKHPGHKINESTYFVKLHAILLHVSPQYCEPNYSISISDVAAIDQRRQS